jgi:hypothetical protein
MAWMVSQMMVAAFVETGSANRQHQHCPDHPEPESFAPVASREARSSVRQEMEEQMHTKRLILAGCAAVILGVGSAMAGPCDTSGRAANLKDAGSGPASTGSGQTTGVADNKEHPPTGTMNRATGDVATSSQDAQRQMQGEPTAAQRAQGAKEKKAGNDC